MSDRYILDDREICKQFVAKHQGGDVIHAGLWFEGIGLERDGELIAAVLYTLMTEHDISMHVAAVPGKKWLTHEFLRVAFRYPFVQLGVKHVSAFVPGDNRAALKLNKHLGFKEEGRQREAEGHCDRVVMGMLERECRWHGKALESTRAA